MTIAGTYPGLKVLDLSTNIAGPFAAMALGDMGADVVKVERPPAGDDTRALPPSVEGVGTVFWAMNRNKRSLVLDLKRPEARAALLRLASDADVVIESFPPGLADKLGLTFEAFRQANPRLVHCTVSAFGEGRLGAAMPGYDALVQAVSGMMSFTGEAGSAPVRIAPSVLDTSTGMWALTGVMAALARRERTGLGEHVGAALIDSAFTLMAHQLQSFQATGEEPEKLGSGAPSAVPYRVYEASDGPLMIATASNPQWPRLCGALGLGALGDDPALATMPGRIAARQRIDAAIAGSVATRDRDAWMAALTAAGISCGRVNSVSEALAQPMAVERHAFHAAEGDSVMPVLRLPIDTAAAAPRRAPPPLGAHSREVLIEAGFSAGDIAALGL